MDKRFFYSVLFGIIIILLLTSCIYTRPILSWRVDKDETQDTITKNIIKTKDYHYYSFKKFPTLGIYSIDREYDINGNLVKLTQYKKTPVYMLGGHVRSSIRTKYFDQNKKIIQIDYYIIQFHGRAAKVLVNMSVFYENGKKLKTIDKIVKKTLANK